MLKFLTQVVTPACFYRGSSSELRLDSRLKHAGMTDFGLAHCTYAASCGDQPTDIENLKIENLNLSDSPRPQVLGEKIADERTVTKRHIVADVVAAFE